MNHIIEIVIMGLLSTNDKEYIPLDNCGVKVIQLYRQHYQETIRLIKLLQTEIGVVHDWEGLYGLIEKSIEHNKLVGIDVYKVSQSLYLQFTHIVTIPRCHFVKVFMDCDDPLKFFVTNMPDNVPQTKRIHFRNELFAFKPVTDQTLFDITGDPRSTTEFGIMGDFGGDWIPFDYQNNPINLKIKI